MLSEVTPAPSPTAAASSLTRIADLAPTLKEAELRVLVHLTFLAETDGQKSCRISARELAKQCRTSRRAVQPALDSLAARGLITTRQGTATTPSAYLLNFLNTVQIGGAPNAPPPAEKQAQQERLALEVRHPDENELRHPGAGNAPPPTDSKQEKDGTSRASIESRFDYEVIDRLLKAKPDKSDAALIEAARRWLHGYMAKLGREQHPHPPDNQILAQFLAIATWPQLEGLLYDLLAERKEPGYSYAWFITVALQRIHGIQPAILKQRRAELKLVSRQQRTDAPPFDIPALARQGDSAEFRSTQTATVCAKLADRSSMTIDERIEALTMNLELLLHQGEAQNKRIDAVITAIQEDAENIRALARIADMHDRFSRLEGKQS